MAAYVSLGYFLSGLGPWLPVNMVAAVIPAFRPPAPTFAIGPCVAGTVLHLATSVAWGLLYGGGVAGVAAATGYKRLPRWFLFASLLGPGWGLVAWLVMGLLIAPRFNPSLTMADQTHYLAGHLVYGLVTALVFAWQANRSQLAVTFAPPAAADVTIHQ